MKTSIKCGDTALPRRLPADFDHAHHQSSWLQCGHACHPPAAATPLATAASFRPSSSAAKPASVWPRWPRPHRLFTPPQRQRAWRPWVRPWLCQKLAFCGQICFPVVLPASCPSWLCLRFLPVPPPPSDCQYIFIHTHTYLYTLYTFFFTFRPFPREAAKLLPETMTLQGGGLQKGGLQKGEYLPGPWVLSS
jgi:hypothetical protein